MSWRDPWPTEDRPRWAPLEGERVVVSGEQGIGVLGTVKRAWYVPPAFIEAGHWEVMVRLDVQQPEAEARPEAKS